MKAIIIDWDNTLVDFNYWQRVRFLELTKWVENELGIKHFDHTFWRIFDAKSQYYLNNIKDTLIELNHDLDLVPKIVEYLKTIQVKDLIVNDAVLFLKQLRKMGYKICMLTMGTKSTYISRPQMIGLDKYFDCMFYGGDIIKPHYDAYHECFAQLGTEDVIVIGDDQRDLLAPYHLGKQCIMVDHFNLGLPRLYDIPVCKNFDEVLERIKSYDIKGS